jgi:DNA polymerase theta
MSTSGQPPFQSRGFETSIDIARRQAYQVAPVTGIKRTSTTRSPEPLIPETGSSVNHKFQHKTRNLVDDIQESKSLESARASLGPLNRFHPSRIRPGTGAGASDADDSKDGQKGTSAPGASQNPLLSLNNPKYGLPPSLTANFAALGVRTIYPWQASCLLARGLLSGERHLVYTAPTGGGKSLVADVLLLKRIIENPARKALLVLPYVALVQEKLKWMRRIVQGVERNLPDEPEDHDTPFPRKRWKKLQKQIRVTGFFGGSRTTATWADTDVAVCTIEKVRYPRRIKVADICTDMCLRPTL